MVLRRSVKPDCYPESESDSDCVHSSAARPRRHLWHCRESCIQARNCCGAMSDELSGLYAIVAEVTMFSKDN
jgi:hypothetical protein